MRIPLTLLAVVAAAAPLAAQGNDPLAFLRRGTGDVVIGPPPAPTYKPVRTGELQAASFLTEMRDMPFGRLLGPVDPSLVRTAETTDLAMIGTVVAVAPPSGTSYQRGDTVVLALRLPGPKGWGEIVRPTGLARIGDQSPRQTLATVIAVYGPIRDGQVVFPLQPVTNPGTVQPVPANGPSGEIIAGAEPRELEQSGSLMFTTLGSGAGVRIGDFVEIRRRPQQRPHLSDTIDDIMAVGQVVHLGDKSSTVKLIRVIDPDIRAGTPVVRSATLGG
ncbi:MAG: hypothetical protein ACREL5_08735 [Gemmatimonadales bacterium]